MTLNSSEENANIDELRRRLKGLMTPEMYEDDSMFRRFLRARNNNMEATETMLINHINWRKINNIDSLSSTYKAPEVCKKYVPLGTLGFNKDDTLLLYCNFGDFDTRGLLKCLSTGEVLNYILHYLEVGVKSIKQRSEQNPVNQLTFILNLEDLPMSIATHRLTIETVIKFVQVYDANYPESLKAAYLINVSFIFFLAWTLIKPFLAGRTIEKIQMFGKDGWQEELKRDVDPSIIPAFLGGELTDADGDTMCRSKICFGGTIPESYYSRKCANSMNNIPGTCTLIVNRMAKAEVKLEVMYPGSRIEWEFEVMCKDIAFSLLYRTSTSQPKTESMELIPKQRVETSLATEVGIYACEKAGIYILEFDNTYSWMHNKEIYYKTSIIRPQSNKSMINQ